jgi:hypothetical protein
VGPFFTLSFGAILGIGEDKLLAQLVRMHKSLDGAPGGSGNRRAERSVKGGVP